MGRYDVALSALLGDIPGTRQGSWDGVTVQGIATDSRRVVAGDLFVAHPGAHTDGRLFIHHAAARGAVACLVSHPAPEEMPLPSLTVDDALGALPDVAARLFRHPARRLVIAGVTGTNGKTTTALLTAHLLRSAGMRVAFWTTTQVSLGSADFRPKWTTPHAHDLQRLLAEAADEGATHAVLEVSSHGIAQERIRHIPFAAAMVTNVTPDHLDFHGDFERYVATKRRFIETLPPSGRAVLNADDAVVRGFAKSSHAPVVLTGCSRQADLRAVYIRQSPKGAAFRIRGAIGDIKAADLPVHLALAGMHNVQNALLAAGTALSLGVPAHLLPAALGRFSPPPRRLERHAVGPFSVLNDVAMNEASYDTVMRTLAAAGVSRPVVVHAVRGQRGTQVNARVGHILGRWNRRLPFAPLLVTLSEDTLGSYPVDYSVEPEELEATLRAAQAEGLSAEVYPTLEGAIEAAVARVRPGGWLVLLGTFGMDEGPAMALDRLAAKAGVDPGPLPHYPRQTDAE